MIQLDDNFLTSVGLKDLPEDQKKPFLQHVYDELELRVGTKLAEGLTDNQLAQFEKIIDKDQTEIGEWLDKNDSDYKFNERFKKIRVARGDELSAKSEYAASRWLEINRPNYQSVVASALDDLKKEIQQDSAQILKRN